MKHIDEKKDRVVWIDVLKGIAILFVISRHHPLTNQKYVNFIFFVMPLFFFISGYLFNPDISWKSLTQKRFNSLLKPYIFTITVISLIYAYFKDSPSDLWYFIWAIYGNAPNLPKLALHLWFLPCLFITIYFVWFINNYIRGLRNSPIFQCLLICCFFVSGYFIIHSFWEIKIPLSITNYFIDDGNLFFINGLVDNPIYSKEKLLSHNQFMIMGLPWTLDALLLTSAFLISGFVVKINKLDTIFFNPFVAFLMGIVFFLLQYFYNYSIDFAVRRYDHMIMPTIAVYAGIYVSIYISNEIAKWNNIISKTFILIGKYSLIIYIFHPIIQSKIYYLGIDFFQRYKYIVAVIAFLSGVIFPLVLNYIMLERFKIFRYWFYSK